MKKIKDEVLSAISKIPDDIKLNEMIYRLYVIGKIHLGKEEAIINGKKLSADDIRKELESWQLESTL